MAAVVVVTYKVVVVVVWCMVMCVRQCVRRCIVGWWWCCYVLCVRVMHGGGAWEHARGFPRVCACMCRRKMAWGGAWRRRAAHRPLLFE